MEDHGDGMSGKRSSDEKFCFACGKVIHATAVSCPHCGAFQVIHSGLPSAPAVETGRALVPSDDTAVMHNKVFCRGCGKPIHKTAFMCPHCGAPQAAATSRTTIQSQKSKNTAGILAIFLGGLGVHKFYLDELGLGIFYLLFCWTFIPAFIALIEGLIYLTMTDEHFARKYG